MTTTSQVVDEYLQTQGLTVLDRDWQGIINLPVVAADGNVLVVAVATPWPEPLGRKAQRLFRNSAVRWINAKQAPYRQIRIDHAVVNFGDEGNLCVLDYQKGGAR